MKHNWKETIEGELDKEFPCVVRATGKLQKLESMFAEVATNAESDELKAAVKACKEEIDRAAMGRPAEHRRIASLQFLPVRVSNALRGRGIVAISQLREESEYSLLRMRGVGPVAIRDLASALGREGIIVPWTRP